MKPGGLLSLARGYPPGWLVLLTALAYFNALTASFQFDDYNIIVDNPSVHSLTAWWQHALGIRPLLKLSYTLNWISGLGSEGFHAVNLLLHLVNVVLLWHLSAYFPRPGAWNAEHCRHARLLATLIFAMHPIQTEAVTYISGRSMVLMACFGLGALLCWMEAERHPRPAPWRLAALVLFAAAVLSKEVAVVLPLSLFLLRQQKPASGRQGLMWILIVIAALALLFFVLGYQRLLVTPPRGLFANLASETNALFYLLGQLFRPHALNIDPDLPELSAWSILLAAQLSLLGSIFLLAWLERGRRPWLTYGIGWFVLLLLPTHSLIPRLDLASERHLYMSGIGLFWLAGLGLTALFAPSPTHRRVTAINGLVAVLAITGVILTASRNRDYLDEVSLWQATIRLSPNKARVWNNLGYAHALAGQFGEARAALLHALSLDPAHARARANLRSLETGRFGLFPPPSDPRSGAQPRSLP